MNHKLLYVLILVFVFPAQKIKAMDGKNYQGKQNPVPIVFNLHNILDAHDLYTEARKNIIKDVVASVDQLKRTGYVIAKSEKTNKNDWPEVFGVIEKNKDTNDENLILSDENITTLRKWRKEYEEKLNIWERIKKKNQPESWGLLMLKGGFATLLPITAGYGMWRFYRTLPPERTFLRYLFWADVVGIGIFSVISIGYGISKLNLALNYKKYKANQDAEVEEDSKTIENIKTKFLNPLDTTFEKLKAAIKDNSITLKEDQLYQLKSNKVSLLS